MRPALALILAALACCESAAAQDFAAPLPGPAAAHAAPAATLLEHGLPATIGAPALELGVIRWHGLAELTTRSAAAVAGWRSLRAGLGLSQTGEPEIGWTALGAAVGFADPRGGAALRAVARRDRTSRFGFDAAGAAVGVEVGGGAWVAAAPGLTLWASAPQLWTRGEAPPEARALALGAALRAGTIELFLARAAVPGFPHGGRGEHAAGLATGAGPLTLALTVRDQPLRGGLGLAARAAGLRVAAAVESHPVMGETVRLALGAGGGR